MSKLSNYLLNEETDEFCIHLLTILPEFYRKHTTENELIEELSKYHGMSKEEVNNKLIKILCEILLGINQQDLVGKHNNMFSDDFDKEELKKGIQIEYEHTNCHLIAAAITRDHLSEIPDYYTRLIKMEQEAKS